jgi:hypothetical protein
MFLRPIFVYALLTELTIAYAVTVTAQSPPTAKAKNGSYTGYFAPAYNTDS